jgi:hypothetical protein
VGKFLSPGLAALGLTLGCFDDPTTHTVTVMPTYAGDFNLDGAVDVADLNLWASNAGKAASWQAGDANYDGVVNLVDFSMLKAAVGLSQLTMPSSGAGTQVPEPGTLAFLGIGLAVGVVCASRKRAAR